MAGLTFLQLLVRYRSGDALRFPKVFRAYFVWGGGPRVKLCSHLMTTHLFLLVCTAAICHASWNFAARKIAGNMWIIWLALWAGCLFMLPMTLWAILPHGLAASVPAAGVPYIIATGVVHGGYFLLLALAYERGEISLVYPVARGSGIGLTALLGSVLLGEDISRIGLLGIVLIVLGILTLGASALGGKRQGARAFTLALGVGATIVCYSLVDYVGVRHVHPIVYIWLMNLISAVVMSPIVLMRFRSRYRQSTTGRVRYIFIIGAGISVTYLLILFAFRDGTVSYVVAAREFGIVFASLLGVVLLGEHLSPAKVVAITAITIGTILMKFA